MYLNYRRAVHPNFMGQRLLLLEPFQTKVSICFHLLLYNKLIIYLSPVSHSSQLSNLKRVLDYGNLQQKYG